MTLHTGEFVPGVLISGLYASAYAVRGRTPARCGRPVARWRLPPLYQEAIPHDLIHALEHASYLWGGMLLWAALLGPLTKPAWFSD